MITQWIEKRNCEQRPLHIIKNGNADSPKSEKVWRKAEAYLKQRRIPYLVYQTEYQGHAYEIAERVAREHAPAEVAIIVVGGDGTFHEVLNGASVNPSAIIGCLPGGSGNDYVRGVQVIKDLDKVIKAAHHEKQTRAVDIGQVESGGKRHSFINSVGMGFDASICQSVNQSKWKKRLQPLKLSKFIYIYYLFQQLFRFRTFDADVTVDGKKKKYTRVWFIVAANQPYFGGGIKVSPKSKPDDGKLQCIIVSGLPSFVFLFVFLTVLWGGHLNLRWVDHYSCSKLSVRSAGKALIEADGEQIGHTVMDVGIKPRRLRIISPFKGE
ncbi:diacylglycerol/lipid kinase family protein [Bacillus sp. 1P06AnD]|uniref:diacylglycerol/lipid kinase family protein n=1 Tax=Bacillus sp. 1P06AnD TaxID=3132208 RepID=UPI0039A31D37